MHVTTNVDALNLGLKSTLEELPFWKVYLELDNQGNDLAKLFEQEPLLPGIILTENQRYIGMISRRNFFEKMSRPFSIGLFSERSIKYLYNALETNVFVFPEDTLIVKATQEALQRPTQTVYEPILVETVSGNYKIIDFLSLLLAYSQIHRLSLSELQQAEEKSKIAARRLRQLQHNINSLVYFEKIAALGQLVDEVAHNIKNPINLITGNLIHANRHIQKLLHLLNLYQQCYPQPVSVIQATINQINLNFLTTELPALFTSVRDTSKQIQRTVRYLSNFSSLDKAEKKEVDIHESIDNVLFILQSRLKLHTNTKSISLVKGYGKIPLVKCYSGQLNLVFSNIISYMIDGLKEDEENRESGIAKEQDFLFSTQSFKPLIQINTLMATPAHVIIRIADNGSGITPEIQKQIFNPLFTTEAFSQRARLGLYISYQIVVDQHGGQLRCISNHGQGTEFIIRIPAKVR